MPLRQNPSDHWFFRFTYRGKEYYHGGFRTRDQARLAEMQAKDRAIKAITLPEARGEDMTLSEAVEVWFSTNPEKCHVSLVNEKSRFQLAKQFFENARLREITQEDVEEFLKELPKLRRDNRGRRPYQGMTQHTRNHYLALLKALWTRLRERKQYFGENPCEGIDKIAVNEARVRYLYEAEEKVLTPIVEAVPEVFAYYFVALHTGCRIGELLRLKVQDVDLILKRLFVGGRTKNRRSRYIPMSEDLSVFLSKRMEGRQLADPLLPKRSYQFIMRNFQELVARAGLRESLHLHDLRHTFTQRLLTHGVPIYKVSKLLGHSSVVVTEKHYGHLAPGDLEEGATVINGVVSARSSVTLALDLHSKPAAA